MRLFYILMATMFLPMSGQATHLLEPLDAYPVEDSLKLKDLKVKDGFLYQNYQEVTVDVKLIGKGKRPLSYCPYKIFIVDQLGNQDLLMAGRSEEDGWINLLLQIPNHIATIVIEREEKLPPKDQYYYAFYKKDFIRIDLSEAMASK